MKVIVLTLVFSFTSAQISYYPESADNAEYSPQPYSFSWEVNDAPSYNNFAHAESSDGKVVSGSYRVSLPDGRIQTVTYKDDSYGYVAEVKYEGEAKYPEYRPSSSYFAPAYKATTYPAASTPAYPALTPVTQVYRVPAAPVYETPAPIYRTPAPLYRLPTPTPAYRASASKAPAKINKAPTPVYEAPTPINKASTSINKAPQSIYEAPTPIYQASTPIYRAPKLTSKAPIIPAYKPALANTYESQSAPVYEVTDYIVPSYKPPVTAPPAYTPSSTPVTPIYRSPAPQPVLYRTRANQATY